MTSLDRGMNITTKDCPHVHSVEFSSCFGKWTFTHYCKECDKLYIYEKKYNSIQEACDVLLNMDGTAEANKGIKGIK